MEELKNEHNLSDSFLMKCYDPRNINVKNMAGDIARSVEATPLSSFEVARKRYLHLQQLIQLKYSGTYREYFTDVLFYVAGGKALTREGLLEKFGSLINTIALDSHRRSLQLLLLQDIDDDGITATFAGIIQEIEARSEKQNRHTHLLYLLELPESLEQKIKNLIDETRGNKILQTIELTWQELSWLKEAEARLLASWEQHLWDDEAEIMLDMLLNLQQKTITVQELHLGWRGVPFRLHIGLQQILHRRDFTNVEK